MLINYFKSYGVIMLFVLSSIVASSQETMKDSLPYADITKTPAAFTTGAIVSRMIDGLGFRYYWATEGLSKNEENYRPSKEGRSIQETIEHVYNLSKVIVNCANKVPNNGAVEAEKPAMSDLRKLTLQNLKAASLIFENVTDFSDYNIIFINANGTTKLPFWNAINGPIEDAVWHAGQIVVLRRSAGNPINSKVNVLIGRLNN